MHTHTGGTLHNNVILTFKLLTSGSIDAEILLYSIIMSTIFGVDSSSRFLFTERTHTQTQHAKRKVTARRHSLPYPAVSLGYRLRAL